MNKVYSIDNLLVNKCEFLDKTLKYSKLELRTCTDRSVCNKHSTYKKLAVQCSADTFVVNQNLVLRINPDCYRDGKNRQLLVAANRQTV